MLINKCVCFCKQSETVASCCVWRRERPSGTGPLRTRWCHVACTGSSAPVGRTPAPCQPTDNPPETATVGDWWVGREVRVREKKENGGRKGKRRGRTLAARKLNAGLFYTVFALCSVLFTKLPLTLSALILFSVFLRHTHIHNRYTHTQNIFLEAIDTVVLVSLLALWDCWELQKRRRTSHPCVSAIWVLNKHRALVPSSVGGLIWKSC